MACVLDQCTQGRKDCPRPLVCGSYANRQHYEAMHAPTNLGGGNVYLHLREELPKPRRIPNWALLIAAWLITGALFFGPDVWAAMARVPWPTFAAWLAGRW